jgi:ubiquitin C-terminal hydrolase
MDKLERNLKQIGKKEVINNIFGGELSNLITGSQCEHSSERIEPFLSIRLEIKDKKSLEEALKEFIKG